MEVISARYRTRVPVDEIVAGRGPCPWRRGIVIVATAIGSLGAIPSPSTRPRGSGPRWRRSCRYGPDIQQAGCRAPARTRSACPERGRREVRPPWTPRRRHSDRDPGAAERCRADLGRVPGAAVGRPPGNSQRLLLSSGGLRLARLRTLGGPVRVTLVFAWKPRTLAAESRSRSAAACGLGHTNPARHLLRDGFLAGRGLALEKSNTALCYRNFCSNDAAESSESPVGYPVLIRFELERWHGCR
jgi:hypothetical protein